jgi:hypothetical protein
MQESKLTTEHKARVQDIKPEWTTPYEKHDYEWMRKDAMICRCRCHTHENSENRCMAETNETKREDNQKLVYITCHHPA